MHTEYKPGQGVLTMVFINDSNAETVYEPDKALDAGSLFPPLDKPWMPEQGRRYRI